MVVSRLPARVPAVGQEVGHVGLGLVESSLELGVRGGVVVGSSFFGPCLALVAARRVPGRGLGGGGVGGVGSVGGSGTFPLLPVCLPLLVVTRVWLDHGPGDHAESLVGNPGPCRCRHALLRPLGRLEAALARLQAETVGGHAGGLDPPGDVVPARRQRERGAAVGGGRRLACRDDHRGREWSTLVKLGARAE